MLYFILIWVTLLIGCAGIGTALLSCLHPIRLLRAGDRFITAVWLGLVILSVTLLATALLAPLSPLMGGIVFSALLAISLSARKTRTILKQYQSQLSSSLILSSLGIAILLAAVMSRQVTWVDTGFYHYSLIQWLAKFGTVPGIALLHRPLGFSSSWFALAAPLNPEDLEARVSAVTNGFAAFVITLQGWICAVHIVRRRAAIADWFMVATLSIAGLLIWQSKTLQVILVSPSPDLPVMLLVIVVTWLFLTLANSAETSTPPSAFDARLIPLVLAAGAVTMKLTAIPLLIVAGLFYTLGPGKRLQRLSIGIASTALVLMPLSISGIVTSGCSFYPSTALCFAVPWLPSADNLEKVANRTHRWVTWYGHSPANLHEWLTLIWTWLNAAKRNQAVILFSFISMLCAIYLIKQNVKRDSQSYLWVMTTGIAGTGFLMLTSPLLRFQLAYIILIPGLLISHYSLLASSRIAADRWQPNSKILSRQVILAMVTCLFAVVISYTNAFSHLLLPPRLPQAAVIQKKVNDVVYFYPSDPQKRICWDAPLPCTTVLLTDVQLRDSSRGIAGGFIRPPSLSAAHSQPLNQHARLSKTVDRL